MQIGALAKSADVSVDTIRFYERRGVLPKPSRRPSGYRTYDDATLGRIKLARALQGLGFTLDEVIAALHEHHRGNATCESERWRLEAAHARIDSKIADLRRVKRDIAKVLAACDAGRCPMNPGSGSAFPDQTNRRRLKGGFGTGSGS
jgi:DNA-binding transcriptional MerR regulator